MKLDLSIPYDRKKAETYFARLLEDKCKIDLKKVKAPRSIEHHAYAHVCIQVFGKELGYTVDEAKQIFKRLFAQDHEWATYVKNGETFVKSFAMDGENIFTKDETSAFIEWLRNLANEHGCYIPTPEEYINNYFEIERHIN